MTNKFGDTPNFTGSLCLTCRCSTRIKGPRFDQDYTLCNAASQGSQSIRVCFPVVECSEYDDKRIPPLFQMEKIAWRFSVDNRKKTMGFKTPAEFKAAVKAGTEPDDD